MKAGYLFRSINVLNILLAAAICGAFCYVVLPSAGVAPKISLPAAGRPAAPAAEKKDGRETAAPIDYSIIGEENLFNPERKIPSEKSAETEKALPKPEFVLYGTVITDGMSVAYLEDKKTPLSTPGRGKRARVLKKGDTLSGFTLKDIEADRVLMARGEEMMTVYLFDPNAKSRNAEEKSKTPPAPASSPAASPPTKR